MHELERYYDFTLKKTHLNRGLVLPVVQLLVLVLHTALELVQLLVQLDSAGVRSKEWFTMKKAFLSAKLSLVMNFF